MLLADRQATDLHSRALLWSFVDGSLHELQPCQCFLRVLSTFYCVTCSNTMRTGKLFFRRFKAVNFNPPTVFFDPRRPTLRPCDIVVYFVVVEALIASLSESPWSYIVC
jgi:hypothetical protein